MKHHESPPMRPSIEEAPKFKLKVLSPHMRYVFLGIDYTLSVIIAMDLNVQQVECLMDVLKRFK